MAKAPRPRPVAEPNDGLTEGMRITFRGRTLELPFPLPIGEKFAVRYATGMPFEAFWAGESRIGEDSILVLWWLARRHGDEPHLSFEQFKTEWPTDLAADDFDVELISDDAEEPTDDPEGSGPG